MRLTDADEQIGTTASLRVCIAENSFSQLQIQPINVGIIDDGVEYVYDDLFLNYNSDLELDAAENDSAPAPRFVFDPHNSTLTEPR
ncbi:hypothetical protein P7L53_07890 [Thermoleptolyngbya sichuanensis XZ-Cy5]|uniref:hypothetical protein n=1 Tax=Thermoleptolyngbya sichuanensis TaxID=2885951 RepID=UPI00240DA1C5|nr:hypothetical protein [Thermoleptolyngbya sichuanensis]MDG2616164.1 hypothetical protein [Thermoleptolyngbya sichuanensis XZ-Cy5]